MADAVVVVVQPTAKSIDIAARATRIAATPDVAILVVANRGGDEEALAVTRAALGPHGLFVVPDDPAILHADREGLAPIDVDDGAPGVAAIGELADRLAGSGIPV